jgi:hypothetical protein
MQQKRPHAPSTAAAQSHWGRFAQSAVVPLATNYVSNPASGAILLHAHHCERFLRFLSPMQVQSVPADEHSAPSAHLGGPGSLAPAGSRLAAEFSKRGQLHVSRWPWSMLGKQVREQDIASHTSEVCLSIVIENVLTGRQGVLNAAKWVIGARRFQGIHACCNQVCLYSLRAGRGHTLYELENEREVVSVHYSKALW